MDAKYLIVLIESFCLCSSTFSFNNIIIYLRCVFFGVFFGHILSELKDRDK